MQGLRLVCSDGARGVAVTAPVCARAMPGLYCGVASIINI